MMEENKFSVEKFLLENGWNVDRISSHDNEFVSFHKGGCFTVDIYDKEIILLDESGDFLHINVNNLAYYTLIGVLIEYKQISYNYKSKMG